MFPRRALLVVLGLLLLASGCRFRSAPPGKESTGALAKLPTFETVDGGRVDLRADAGKVVLINRWATWCSPCRDEIPALAELGRVHAAEGLRVYGLSDEESAVQKPVAAKLGADYPLLVESAPLGKPFESSGYVPETYVIARDGRLAEVVLGGRDRRAFEEIIAPLLKEPKP